MTGHYLREALKCKLSLEELKKLCGSFDVIGSIAIIKIPKELDDKKETIADVLMNVNKNVKTVLRQVGPVRGTFRLRKLEWIAGEKKTETVYREYGCQFIVDVSKVYFSPRLSYERIRIANQVTSGETVVNMFAGVGCFSIIIAKHSKAKKIYSIDINLDALKYMKENIRLNRVENRVIPIGGDAEEIINSRLKGVAHRVLMPLPGRAYEYLGVALASLRKGGGWIHFYDFIHANKTENPIEKAKEKISSKMMDLNPNFVIQFGRVVRTVGPNWHQIVLDIQVHSPRREN